MPNVFEAVTNVVRSMTDDEPKAPLHIGEVMSCWTYLPAVNAVLTTTQVALNTATDADLQKALLEVERMSKSQQERLQEFMRQEGVPLPSLSELKPKCDPKTVPQGGRFTDDEIANGLAASVASGVIACSTAATEAVRNDVMLMWFQFQSELVTFGATLKTLMRRKSWLKTPPAYTPLGSPSH